MAALKTPATRKSHANVLLHLLGYIRAAVKGAERQDIATIIDSYRRGEVNLATPLTLLSHYLKRHGSEYAQMQRYLEPYPKALGLTNAL